MKFPKILIALSLLLVFSCIKDENQEAIEALAGHWHVWDFEPSASSPAEDSMLAKEAILRLVKVGCDPIEFTFKENKNVFYRTGMQYLNASMGDEGVQVNCAPTYNDRSGSFDFDYENLTLNLDSETIEFKASVDEQYLTTEVTDMLINGVNVSGTLYFIKETGE